MVSLTKSLAQRLSQIFFKTYQTASHFKVLASLKQKLQLHFDNSEIIVLAAIIQRCEPYSFQAPILDWSTANIFKLTICHFVLSFYDLYGIPQNQLFIYSSRLNSNSSQLGVGDVLQITRITCAKPHCESFKS